MALSSDEPHTGLTCEVTEDIHVHLRSFNSFISHAVIHSFTITVILSVTFQMTFTVLRRWDLEKQK